MDDDRSMDLDMYEFRKAIKDFRITIMERDIERLFNVFDRDRSGKISYDEFLRSVRVRFSPKVKIGRHEQIPCEFMRACIQDNGQGQEWHA